MKESLSIVKATALEILSEPLTLLVLLAALVLTVLAPAFHYHQFGDPTRMARDAGLSALFTCGSAVAAFGVLRSLRREIETGTMEMALAHAVSRACFFLSKAAGGFLAYLAFAAVVTATAAVVFAGAEVGGLIARRTGDIARLYGPCLAAGVAVIVLPLLLAATLNRFAGFRFVLSAFALALAFSVLAAAFGFFLCGGSLLCLLPAVFPIVLLAGVVLSAAAAFAVRFRTPVAAAALGGVLAAAVPAVGNYYLADALTAGRAGVTWAYVATAAAVTLPAVAAFLLIGVEFIRGRDIQWTT